MSSLFRGNITSQFSPPASCTTDFYRVSVGEKFFDGVGPSPTPTECFPPNWTPSAGIYYSPAQCPMGWTAASSTVVGKETQLHCCPSGYSSTSVGGVFWAGTLSCVQSVSTFLQVLTEYSTDNVPVATVTGITANNWWAYSVQVRYQATDLALFSAAASRTGQAASIGSSSSHSLSTGAIIGIAVGAGIGAFMFLAGVLLLCLSKRRKRRRANQQAGNTPSQPPEKQPEMSPSPPQYQWQPGSWQSVEGNQPHSYSYHPQNAQNPQNPIFMVPQGNEFVQVDPAELAGSTGPSQMGASELPVNSPVQRHSQHSFPSYSTPSPHMSYGTAPSPNFSHQQR